MSDINSLIANYLQKTGNENNYAEVTQRIYDLANSITDITSSSIFSYGTDGATEDELLSFMSDITGKDSNDIADDVDLLFDILNSESDDNVLTDDEMSMLVSHADGGISAWGIYNQLISNPNAEAVYNQLNPSSDSQSDDDDLIATESGNDEETTTESLSETDIQDIAQKIINGDENLSDYYGQISEEDYNALSAAIEELQESADEQTADDAESDSIDDTDSDTSDTTTSDTNAIEEMKEKIQEICLKSDSDDYKCPEDVISELEASGEYDEEFIEQLRNSYITYSDEDEEKISTKLEVLQLINPDATREDAIAALEKESNLGSPITDSNTELTSDVSSNNSGSSITEETAKHNAEKLYNAMKGNNTDFFFGLGTNETAVDDVFNDENLTSADWVKIMQAYSDEYGSALVSDIDWDYGDGSQKQTEYYEKIVDNLLTEIDAGNEDAINVLCQQIYGATAGQIGTADEFMEILFDKIGDEALAQVAEKYSDVTGSDLTTDITKDYHKVVGRGANKTGQEYLSRIDEVINKYGREEN